MDRNHFLEEFKAFLMGLDPGADVSELKPDTHLWEAGYLDSFAMLNVVVFIEEKTGREVTVDADALPTFFTINRMYETYVASHKVER